MTAGSTSIEEPLLAIPRPPRFWPMFGWPFTAFVAIAVVSTVTLVVESVRPAPDQVVVLNGIMASKADFFRDPEVQRLLLKHRFRVDLTVRGSREVAHEVIANPDRYHFAFPSGQPAADSIKNDRAGKKLYNRVTRLFTSPLVLTSYREYADTLVNFSQVATPHGPTNAPLYYTLNMDQFIALGEQRKRWNDIGLSNQRNESGVPLTNSNQVLAHHPGVCRSNAGVTYLALVAYVSNGYRPAASETEIDMLATKIGPLLSATGMPEAELFRSYETPEGRSQGPIVVVYEHQYIAYQLERLRSKGRLDTDRVLLYPKQAFESDPEFVSLKEGPADRLAELLQTDPELRLRAMQLGYRVLDATSTTSSDQLFRYLTEHGVPAPIEPADRTRAEFPQLDLLETLVKKVGRCPA